MTDFFLAGSDTTSTTLNWAVLHLLHYPNIQAKLQEELDKVVGKSRWPSLTDRNRSVWVSTQTYTINFVIHGTILKLLEWCLVYILRNSIQGTPQKLTTLEIVWAACRTLKYLSWKSGEFRPSFTAVFHMLPQKIQNSMVTLSRRELRSILACTQPIMTPTCVWGDPENFRPERFLSKDGTQVERHESLIPFSVGKRSCLGEVLARDQLFLFVECLAQRFNIISEPGKPKPILEAHLGQHKIEPHHYAVIMEGRL